MSVDFILCMIAISLFMGGLWVSVFGTNNYYDKLDDYEKEKYKLVVKERTRIYLYTIMISITLITILLINDIKMNNRMNTMWFYLAIYFVSEYFIYMLWPKKHWMLQSVKTNQDATEWLEKYKHMQKLYHIGLLMGILGVAIFAYSYFDYQDIECNIYVMN